MYRHLAPLLCWLLFAAMPLNAQEADDRQAELLQRWQQLHPQHGDIKLPGGVATLHVPDTFIYLNPADAEAVLSEFWGNPPGATTLGMLMPAGITPLDQESWAVTIEYEQDGHVSDEDASEIDYADLLKDMQADAKAANKEREKLGYEPVSLVGWAASPYYDASAHKLHWAKELRFGDSQHHTLNYNIRVLGREGVLVLNFIAGMEQKSLIDAKLDQVLKLAEFNPGSRYEDFDPGMDKVAAYGLGALITGKVAAKTGLLAAALLFAKKFGVFIIAGIGALIGRLFKRNQ